MPDIFCIADKLYNDASTFIYDVKINLDLIKGTPLAPALERFMNGIVSYEEERKKLVDSISFDGILRDLKKTLSDL